MDSKTVDYVSGLIKRARAAQARIENYTQEQVDKLCRAVSRSVTTPEEIKKIGTMVFEEAGYGDLESKFFKLETRVKGTLWDVLKMKSVGVLEEFPERGLIKIAKSVGVVAGLVPSTQPEVTPVIKALFALKARDAIIFCPHPKTTRSTGYVIERMRQALKKYGAPEDLLICAEKPTVDMTNELMRQADLVVATGGAPMVRAAYSSGTPAYGAGAGNSNVVVDETADIEATAKLLINSKYFDQSSGCSCENAAVVHSSVYDSLIGHMKANGAYLLNAEEKEKLRKALWPNWPKDHALGRDVILQRARVIAERAGFSVPPETKLLLVEESGSGPDYPFSGEKLSVVLTIYKYDDFDQAMNIVRANQEYQGLGHSCGIHSFDDEKIMRYALTMKSTRVAVRQAMTASNSGSWTSGNHWTSTLGCGTWGKTIVAENITVKHFLNFTWVARPIEPYIPTEEELFAGLD